MFSRAPGRRNRLRRGVFTTQQSPLAKIAKGCRIEKIANEPGDARPIGAIGTVLCSVGVPDLGVAYFIEFDATPRQATFVAEGEIAAIAAE